jgi:hypothetical protein
MRFAASIDPRSAPWQRIAWSAYSEQVGKKRQLGPNIGLIKYW